MEKKKQIVLKLLMSCLVCTLICSMLVFCETDGEGETESATETIAQTEEKTEGKTEAPTEIETETETDSSETTTDETSEEATEEQSTEGGDNETDTAVSNIPELMENKLEFTLELTETVYTTESDRINYRITSREPGGYIVRGDQWLLYRIENDKANLIGEIAWEIAIEYIANDDEEYITRDEYLTIKMLCGKENLDVGEYCLVYPIQLPDDEGIYHRYAGAIMYFEVVE